MAADENEKISEPAPVDPPSPEEYSPPAQEAMRVGKRPLYRRPVWMSVLCVLLVIAGIAGVRYWLYARQYETTDDAFVDGEIVQVSAKVSGIIQSVEVDDNQDVAAGTVLVRIDPADLQARLNQAEALLEAAEAKWDAANTQVELVRANTEAALAEAQAGVEQAKAAVESSRSQLASSQSDVAAAEAESTRRQADLKRYKMLDQRAVSQQQLDAAQAAMDAAQANLTSVRKRVLTAEAAVTEARAKQAASLAVLAAAHTGPKQVAAAMSQVKNAQAGVQEAKADVRTAELNLSYTTIAAPVGGRVSRRMARTGQYLQAGQIVMALVEPNVWATANFKETQLTHMCQGQEVEMEVDAYPGHVFHGKIDSIQAGTGARFSLLPPENATGNYVKVVQRVPVKIRFDPGETRQWLLAPGMSVIPSVHVGTDPNRRPLPITLTNPAALLAQPVVTSSASGASH
ncbi:MAG: HlyD family secretion protein [Phycisphaeraceae bacterium]